MNRRSQMASLTTLATGSFYQRLMDQLAIEHRRESGRQKGQHNTQYMTALLRKEASVDTLETNSLCCAAAGIIASSSSTTEALIPHEKLREAAATDATLIAQNRPPAQPEVGYKHHQNSNSCEDFRDIRPRSFSHALQSDDSSIFCELHVIPITIIKRWIFEIPFSVLSNVGYSVAQLQPTQCNFRQWYLGETHFSRKYLALSKRTKKFSDYVIFRSLLVYIDKSVDRYLGSVLCYSVDLLQKLIVLVPHSFDALLALLIGNPDRDQNRSDRSNCLNPSGSVLFCVESIEQHKQRPAQSTNSQKQPHYPDGGQFHLWWNRKSLHIPWHLTLVRAMGLPAFHRFFLGGNSVSLGWMIALVRANTAPKISMGVAI